MCKLIIKYARYKISQAEMDSTREIVTIIKLLWHFPYLYYAFWLFCIITIVAVLGTFIIIIRII